MTGKRQPEVSTQLLDDLGAPALASLAGENLPTDLPIQADELLVDGRSGPKLRGPNPIGEDLQKLAIALRRVCIGHPTMIYHARRSLGSFWPTAERRRWLQLSLHLPRGKDALDAG